MDEYKSPEVFIELADVKSMEAFIDDSAWESKFNTIAQAIGDNRVGGGIFIHPGMEVQIRGNKDAAVRRAAALLLRMLELIAKLKGQGLHYVLVTPLAKGSDDDIRNHGIAKEIQASKASGFDLDDVSYQIVSDISACHDQEDLDACLRTAVQAINMGPTRSGVAPAPDGEHVVSSGVAPATGRLPESSCLRANPHQNQVSIHKLFA